MGILRTVFFFVRGLLLSRSTLAAENLALRQQLLVRRRSVKRPQLRRWNRVFWAWHSRWWRDWSSCLVLVKPKTMIRWQRQGFKLYWRWKCWRGKKLGRPPIDQEIRDLIRQMSEDNIT